MSDTAPAPPQARHPRRALSIGHILRPHWKALTLALVAVVGETLTDILDPWPIKVIIDNVLRAKALPEPLGALVTAVFGQGPHAVLNFAVTAVAGIAIVGAASAYFDKYLTTSVSQWVGHDLRRTLYQHIQRLSLAEHDKVRTGDLITRVTSDIEVIQSFIDSVLLGMLVSVTTLAGMIGVMFYLNWRFTLIALSVMPVLFLVVYRYTRRIKKASRAVRKKEGDLLSVVEEVLTSIRVVKAFAREDYEQERFDSESLANVEAGLEARSVKAKLAPLVGVIVAVGTCLVLWYGARLALAGQLTAGTLVLFIWYLGKMYKPMRDLSKMADTVSKAAVGYERIQEVLDIESAVRDAPGARRAPPFGGRIEFDDVCFDYGADKPILKNVSFTIEPGQVAAIRRSVGGGQDDHREPDSPVLRPGVRTCRSRGHGHSAVPPEVAARPDQLRAAGHAALSRDHLGEHRVRQAWSAAARRSGARPSWRTRTNSSRRCRTATTRWSASAASRSRAANASALRLPAPSSATRRS